MILKRVELTEAGTDRRGGRIDPNILNLIVKMNELPFIETTWSCGGHVELTGCILYHRGISFLVDKDSEDGRRFVEELKRFIEEKYPFAKLTLPFPNGRLGISHPEYILEVDCFKHPELKDRGREERRVFLQNRFNETYAKLNADLEAFIDRWLFQHAEQYQAV